MAEPSEESLNVALAELLAERGLEALGEVVLRRGRGRPDVLIELNGVRIVIEGKKPGMWSKLVEQCEGRLDNGDCDLCVMVEYAEIEIKLRKLALSQLDIKNALLEGRFNVGFMSYIDRAGLYKWIGVKREPEKYTGISFGELLTHLITAYTRVVEEDIIGRVIERMSEVLDRFARSVSSTVNVERLRQVLEFRELEEERDEY